MRGEHLALLSARDIRCSACAARTSRSSAIATIKKCMLLTAFASTRAMELSQQPVRHSIRIVLTRPALLVYGAGSDGVYTFWDKDSKQRLKLFNRADVPITCSTFNRDSTLR